jgi:catechol 2,3-dioxygenase-like lactoylglutathione lyase family enzyme
VRLNQVTLPARDLDASAAFYLTLGFRPIVISPHYRRFLAPEGDATLSLHVGGVAGDACVYLETDHLDAEVARLSTAGIAFDAPPTDQSWLWREAWTRDPAGNRVCLYFAGENRLNPPWRVKDGT